MSSFNIVAKLWLGFLNCVHFEFAWSIVILFWYLEPVIIQQDYFECKIFLLFYQGSNDPQFLKTIGFGDKDGVDLNMRVKITVYHVKERLTGTVSIRLPYMCQISFMIILFWQKIIYKPPVWLYVNSFECENFKKIISSCSLCYLKMLFPVKCFLVN